MKPTQQQIIECPLPAIHLRVFSYCWSAPSLVLLFQLAVRIRQQYARPHVLPLGLGCAWFSPWISHHLHVY